MPRGSGQRERVSDPFVPKQPGHRSALLIGAAQRLFSVRRCSLRCARVRPGRHAVGHPTGRALHPTPGGVWHLLDLALPDARRSVGARLGVTCDVLLPSPRHPGGRRPGPWPRRSRCGGSRRTPRRARGSRTRWPSRVGQGRAGSGRSRPRVRRRRAARKRVPNREYLAARPILSQRGRPRSVATSTPRSGEAAAAASASWTRSTLDIPVDQCHRFCHRECVYRMHSRQGSQPSVQACQRRSDKSA